MPGIVGIFSKEGAPSDPSRVEAMTRSVTHEKFYTSGTYVNADLGLSVGWVCHKGSFSDCLPIWNETKDVCLVLVGEVFPERTELEYLRSKGHSVSTDPKDASYLVHQYEESGLSFLEQLNGWFNGVLIDLRKRQATLFNDRYGLARLYYHLTDEALYFASEAKALLKVLPSCRRLDSTSLAEFLSCGCPLQGRTLFSQVHLLPCAASWTHVPGRPITSHTYFDSRAWIEQLPLNETEYYEQLRDTWKQILPRYFSGAQDVGLSMTGGLDSRMILAWAPREAGSLPCYTFGGRYRECADVTLARKASRVCGQPHRVLHVGDEFLKEFPTLAEKSVYVSDGAMDVTGSIDLYVQRLAREIAPVRLTGVNGGEILRQLVAFAPQPPNHHLFSGDLAKRFHSAALTYWDEIQGNRLAFIAFKQAPWYLTGKFSVERSQITFRTPYFDNELVKLAFRVPPTLSRSTAPALRLIREGNPELAALATDRGLALRSLPGVTRAMNMLHEFTFRAEYAYDYGMPQWLARIDGFLRPLHIERVWLGRHKFHHFRVYYRDELSKYLKEILLDSRTRTRPYLDATMLEKMVNRHIAGTGNYTTEIHKALTLELLNVLLLDGA